MEQRGTILESIHYNLIQEAQAMIVEALEPVVVIASMEVAVEEQDTMAPGRLVVDG